MIEIRQTGYGNHNNFIAVDTINDIKLFDVVIENGEVNFKDRFGKLKWCLRYNNTALLMNLDNRSKQKAYFEIYTYSCGIEGLKAKVDYMPSHSDLLGLKFIDIDPDEKYILRKSDTWFALFNTERVIESLIYRQNDRDTTTSVYSYSQETEDIEFYIVLSILIDNIWFVHRYESFRIDYRTNFVCKSPKKPKIGEFKKAKKELVRDE